MPIGVGIITQTQLAKPCVGQNELINACITQSKLKTSTGTWSIYVSTGEYAGVDLVDYTFLPKQRVLTTTHYIWVAIYVTEELYRIFSYNSGSPSYWYGTYRYVTASEQIVEVYRELSTDRVIGVHVTEKGNENSVHYFDNNKVEISVKREVYNYVNTPNLFEEKFCILSATKIMNNLLENKVIYERN